jgi:hypothetical protein
VAEAERASVVLKLLRSDDPNADQPGETGAESGSFPVGPVVLMVGGGVVFGVGLAVGLIGVAEAGDAPSPDGEEADAAKTKALAGDVVAGVGIATAAAGLIWLLVDDGDAEATTSAWTPEPWAQGPVGGLRWTF